MLRILLGPQKERREAQQESITKAAKDGDMATLLNKVNVQDEKHEAFGKVDIPSSDLNEAAAATDAELRRLRSKSLADRLAQLIPEAWQKFKQC